MLIQAWFPYDCPDHPDCPSYLKQCSHDQNDHMESCLEDHKGPAERVRRPQLICTHDNRCDRVNFEAIIWKCSQTTETITMIIIIKMIMHFMTHNAHVTWKYAHTHITIKRYPRNPHFYSSDQE